MIPSEISLNDAMTLIPSMFEAPLKSYVISVYGPHGSGKQYAIKKLTKKSNVDIERIDLRTYVCGDQPSFGRSFDLLTAYGISDSTESFESCLIRLTNRAVENVKNSMNHSKPICRYISVIIDGLESILNSSNKGGLVPYHVSLIEMLNSYTANWKVRNLPIFLIASIRSKDAFDIFHSGSMTDLTIRIDWDYPLDAIKRHEVVMQCLRDHLINCRESHIPPENGEVAWISPHAVDIATEVSKSFMAADIAAAIRRAILFAATTSSGIESKTNQQSLRINDECIAQSFAQSSPSYSRSSIGTLERAVDIKLGGMLNLLNEFKKPISGLAAVVGFGEVVQTLRRIYVDGIWGKNKNNEIKRSTTANLLVCGAPGCGKSYLIRALASECKINLLTINASDITRPEVGLSEQLVAKAFDTAIQCAPCLLLIESIDAICPAGADKWNEADDEGGGRTAEANCSACILSGFDRLQRWNECVRLRNGDEFVVVVGTALKKRSIDERLLVQHRLGLGLKLDNSTDNILMELLKSFMRGRSNNLTHDDYLSVLRTIRSKYVPTSDCNDKDEKKSYLTVANVAASCTEAGVRAVRRVLSEGRDGPVELKVEDFVASS